MNYQEKMSCDQIIEDKYKDLLLWSNEKKYNGFKTEKFDGNKFEVWRTQNILQDQRRLLKNSQKKAELER